MKNNIQDIKVEDKHKVRGFSELKDVKDEVISLYISLYKSNKSPVNQNTFKEILDEVQSIMKRFNSGEEIDKTEIDSYMARVMTVATYCRSAATLVPDNFAVKIATKNAKGDAIRTAEEYEAMVAEMRADLADQKKYTLMNGSYTKVINE